MATPINASLTGDIWHLSIEDLLEPLPECVRLGGPGPFVINLSASTAPISQPSKALAEISTAHVYQIQRTEDRRLRYRLRLGPFATEDEAIALLDRVRDLYPSALTATADVDDLRIIASLQAKLDTALRRAAKPIPKVKQTASFTTSSVPGPKSVPQFDDAPKAVVASAAKGNVVLHTVAPEPRTVAPEPRTVALESRAVAAEPRAAAESHLAAIEPSGAAAEPHVPAIKPPRAAAAEPHVPAAKPLTAAAERHAPATKPSSAAVLAAHSMGRAFRAAAAVRRIGRPGPASERPAPARAAPPRVPRPATPLRPATATTPQNAAQPPGGVRPNALPRATTPSARAALVAAIAASASTAQPASIPVLSDSIDAPRRPPPWPAPGASISAPLASAGAAQGSHPASVPSANTPAPAASVAAAVKPVPTTTKLALEVKALQETLAVAAREERLVAEHSRPDLESTQTLRPLTTSELQDAQALRWFVVQLSVSEESFDPDSLPNLDIFNEYRLYSVAGLDADRVMHSLRLGFFAEEGAASAVANYLSAYYEKPTVKRVSVAERERFADQRVEARKDIGATGRHAVIEITNERVVREKRTTSAFVTPISLRVGQPGTGHNSKP